MKIEDFDWKTAIKSITFPPFACDNGNRGLYDVYHYYLTNKLGFEKNQILMSRLYDKKMKSMTTMYKLKYR